MKGRAVKVCAKAGIERKVRHKNQVIVQIFNKVALKVESLDSSRCILYYYWWCMGKIILLTT